MSHADRPRRDDPPDPEDQGRVLSVHLGESASCSSVGSFVDFLFLSTVAGGAVLSAVTLLVEDAARGGAAEDRGDAEGSPSRPEGETKPGD
ncbi:MAG: hypothetical protein ACFCGT_02235 [Sandaracinaceae bacterium]